MKKAIDAEFSREPDLPRLYRAHALLEKDSASAIAELEALAALGSTMSMIYLGDTYKSGDGTKVDLTKSEFWYRRAAEAGSFLGCFLLGRLYLKLDRYADAKQAFTIAADQGYIPAVHYLGRIYYYGRGVPRDLSLAREYLERASRGGSVFAKRKLATLLLENGQTIGQRFRGIFLLCGSFIDFFVAICTGGLTSERLR